MASATVHPMASHPRALTQRAGVRLAGCSALGALVAALSMANLARSLSFDVMAGWTTAAFTLAAWTWLIVRGMDEHEAAEHAREEDPSVTASELVVLTGTVASLGGVGLLLAAAGHHSSGTPEALLGAGSVLTSWFLVHLVYTLRYAREYYGGGPGAHGIDFEGGEPDYYDFAYVAFDLGMTYQIADTNLKNRQMRRLVLAHTLLSYVLGVGVVATTLNLVVSLASS